MSNQVINAVIALVEDRAKDAREMLRSPGSKIDIGEVQTRLAIALNERVSKAQIEVLKRALRSSLHLDPSVEIPKSDEEREAYLLGVSHVEGIIDDIIEELES